MIQLGFVVRISTFCFFNGIHSLLFITFLCDLPFVSLGPVSLDQRDNGSNSVLQLREVVKFNIIMSECIVVNEVVNML